MGKEELKNQRKLLETALQHADDATLHAAIDGTLGDAQSFCWAAQEQFRRLWSQPPISESPRINAQFSADLHILLEVLSVTVDHVAWLERLLNRRGEAVRLPPTDGQVRKRVKQARNLLAAHRDERVVYRRLTAEHTPHVLAPDF